MAPVYHEGELLVQASAGVCETAERMASMVRSAIPTAVREFLIGQPMAIAGTAGPSGQVWASLLTGRPGFLRAEERTLRVKSARRQGDPFWKILRANLDIGLLVVDFATRRRARLNGTVASMQEDSFVVELAQVYPNCAKYIQARQWSFRGAKADEIKITRSKTLTVRQQKLIAAADTFFIASAHPRHGADASHRGGRPGFVAVRDETRLQWPDYKGNSMFQTLGNLAVHPAAGLLFLDWQRGATLQLSGFARVIPRPYHAAPSSAQERHAEERHEEDRRIEFTLREAIEISGGLPLEWRFLSPYPFNP